MKAKIAKGVLFFVMILYFVFLTVFGIGDFLYPDTDHLFVGEEPESVFCFSFEKEEVEIPASSLLAQRTDHGRIMAFGFLPVKNVTLHYYSNTEVAIGGELFGVRLETKGLLVTSVGEVETENGSASPGKEAGIKKGDVILSANGMELENAVLFSKILAKSGGNPIEIKIEREGEEKTLSLTPLAAADKSGYKAGLWVRDGAAGLGTVTFRDPANGNFAGLGHPICDTETGVPFPFLKGTVCRAEVEKVAKGENGKPGEIRGKLQKESIGTLFANTDCGIFGKIEFSSPSREKTYPLSFKDSVAPGKATIFCTLDENGKQEYEIEIEEIIGKDRKNKNFIVHITDPELIEKTGGIVQGMSGSPIVQNGKLIGAVTHVLISDPTRGYGIFIENMLETAQRVTEEQKLKEAS